MMPVSNSIQNFRQNVIKRGGGPQYASKYVATMVWPGGSQVYYPLSVVLPGRNYAFFEHDIWGTVRKVPYKRGYTQCNMTFIIYQDWGERNFIERWMNAVVLNKNGVVGTEGFIPGAQGGINVPSSTSQNALNQITRDIRSRETKFVYNSVYDEFSLYTDAVGTIEINCFSSDNATVTKKVTLKEAFPAQISPAALGADATAYPTFTVGFQFNEYLI